MVKRVSLCVLCVVMLYVKGQEPVEIVSTLTWYPVITEFTTNGDVAYLADYDPSSETASLMLYRNGKRIILDTDITTVVSFTATDSIQSNLWSLICGSST